LGAKLRFWPWRNWRYLKKVFVQLVLKINNYLFKKANYLLFINKYFAIFELSNKTSTIMSKTNNFVFWGLYIVAWLIFVGLSIEAGGLIVNFFFSIYKPEFVQNLYQKLDLIEMYRDSRLAFFGIYSFILIISILKACLFYIVIRLMHKMDLSKPFSTFVARQISQISYYTLSIGLLSYIARQLAKNLMHYGFVTDNLNQFWADSQAFILMGAVIYIIATIFKKGVDIQNENELTV
jgi:hypothetical protein